MKAYFDRGILFKLYWREPNSAEALRLIRQFEPPISLSRFNEIEILHVARRKTWLLDSSGRPQLSVSELGAGLTLFEEGLREGFLRRIEVDYDEVFDRALDLSRRHGQTLPIKSADLLHLAMMSFGFDTLVTGDRQQHEFAVRIGLRSQWLAP